MSLISTPNLQRARGELDDRWILAEQMLAIFCTFVVAARPKLGGGLVAGDPLAWVLIPLWVPVLRRYRGASSLVGLLLIACCSSWMLTRFASADHHVSMKLNAEIIKLLLSTATSVGLLLWVREHLDQKYVYLVFGLGMVAAGPSNRALFATNQWKFFWSVPLTVVIVGWLASELRPRLTLALLGVFGALCMLNDARSNFAVLLLTMVLVVWRLLPRVHSRRSTVAGTLAMMGAIAASAYYGVQAAILDGVLGESTRARTAEQLQASGSLLMGARPEFGASTGLLQLRPGGFGGGTFLTTNDLVAAKDGMKLLNFDPNNGYVEKFMFGRGIELHSMVFDLWAWAGPVGVLVALVILAQTLFLLGHQLITEPAAGAVLIFVSLLTLWNLPFSPWLASMPITILTLGVGLVRRQTRRLPGAAPSTPRRSAD